MNSNKKNDLAEELVEFLLKEDQEKKTVVIAQSQDNKKSGALRPAMHSGERQVSDAELDPSPRVVKNISEDLAEVSFQIGESPVTIASFDFNKTSDLKDSSSGQKSKVSPLEEFRMDKNKAPEPKMAEVKTTVFKIDDLTAEDLKPYQITEEKVKSDRQKLAEKQKVEDNKTYVKTEVLVASNEAPLPTQVSRVTSLSEHSSTQRSRGAFHEAQNFLAGTEALKAAQGRILTLERERDRLRDETDTLLTATENLQRQFNELKAQYDSLERKQKERVEILEDEKAVVKTRLSARDAELEKLKKENEELKSRFQTDLRKIRVRERELEHRQEIMKAENQTVVQSKDEIIVALKRQMEKLHFEIDNFRAKSADMNARLSEFYDRNHRTVKALRLALSVLETGDGDDKKKTG